MQEQRPQRTRPSPNANAPSSPPQRPTVAGTNTPYLQPRSRRRPPPPVPEVSTTSTTPLSYPYILPSSSTSPSTAFGSDSTNTSQEPIIVRRPKRPPPGAPRRLNTPSSQSNLNPAPNATRTRPPDPTSASPSYPTTILKTNPSPFPYTPSDFSPNTPPVRKLSSNSSRLQSSPKPSPMFLPTPTPTDSSFIQTDMSSNHSSITSSNANQSPSPSYDDSKSSTPPFVPLDNLSNGYNSSTGSPITPKDVYLPSTSTKKEFLFAESMNPTPTPTTTTTTTTATATTVSKDQALFVSTQPPASNPFLPSPTTVSPSSPSSYLTISPDSVGFPETLDLSHFSPNLRMLWFRMKERMELEQKLKQTALNTLYLHAKQPDLVALTHTHLVRTFDRIELIYQGMIQFLLSHIQPDTSSDQKSLPLNKALDAPQASLKKEKSVPQDLALAYEELRTKYNEQSAQFAELLAKTVNQTMFSNVPENLSDQTAKSKQLHHPQTNSPPFRLSDITTSSLNTDNGSDTTQDLNDLREEPESVSRPTSLGLATSGPSQEMEQELNQLRHHCEELESELASLRLEANAHQDILDLAYSREAQLQEKLLKYETGEQTKLLTVDQSVLTDFEFPLPSSYASQRDPSSTSSITLDQFQALEDDLKSSIEREMELKIRVLEAQETMESIQMKEKRYLLQIQELQTEIQTLRDSLARKEDEAIGVQDSKSEIVPKSVFEEMYQLKEKAEQRCVELETQLSQLSSQLEEVAPFREKYESLELEYIQLKKAIAELNETKSELEDKCDQLNLKLAAAQTELEDLRTSYDARYQSDLKKLESELFRINKERDTLLNEFDIMIAQSTEWMEKSRTLESKLDKLQATLRETEAQLEEARVVGVSDGSGSHVQLRAEFRKQLQWLQTEHRKELDLEIQERVKLESEFRDYKKEVQMEKFRKVTTGAQTYSIYTGDGGLLE